MTKGDGLGGDAAPLAGGKLRERGTPLTLDESGFAHSRFAAGTQQPVGQFAADLRHSHAGTGMVGMTPDKAASQALLAGALSPAAKGSASGSSRGVGLQRENSLNGTGVGGGGGGGSNTNTLSSAVMAELLYCTVSAGTILFNKHALSTFGFPAPNTLLLFQFCMAVALLKCVQILGFVQLEPLRWQAVQLWAPLNLIFVAMNVTGFFALQAIGAGMFTVLKNLANLMTIAGDWYFYGLTYSWQVWLCLMLMIVSAMIGGWTDLQFNLEGYAWQMVNCVFTAAYSLYLAAVIKKASVQQHDKKQLTELSMVYYNNVLSIPPLVVLVLLSGELYRLPGYRMMHSIEFQIVAILGGLMGFSVSFASIWCMSRTSPTIYSLTGSLNKVVVALVGMWFFAEPTTPINLLSIGMGLLAGLMFVFAKSSPTNRREVRERRDGSSGGIGASGISGGPPGAQGSGWLSPTSSGLVKLEDGSALQGQGLGQAQGDGRTR